MLPMTQKIPDRMIVFLRPILSASFVTAKDPTKEPAGMEATIAPCGFEDG